MEIFFDEAECGEHRKAFEGEEDFAIGSLLDGIEDAQIVLKLADVYYIGRSWQLFYYFFRYIHKIQLDTRLRGNDIVFNLPE